MTWLWFVIGVAVGFALAAGVAWLLGMVAERKFRAEIEVLETENGLLKMQLNSKAAKISPGNPLIPHVPFSTRIAPLPGTAAINRGGGTFG